MRSIVFSALVVGALAVSFQAAAARGDAPVPDAPTPPVGAGAEPEVLVAQNLPSMPSTDPWTLAMTSCPDAAIGSLAHAWPEWTPDEEEASLLAFDLEGSGTEFGLLADFEGTSIILRVRDAATGDSVAVIKTRSSNTRVEAEIYAHRLSEFLGFDHLVPDTADVMLEGGALTKTRRLLRDADIDDEQKEERRQRVLRQVEEAIRTGGGFRGAMKPWLGAFMFHAGLGHRESFADHAVMRYLRHRGPQPDDATSFQLRQYTSLYSPQGTHQGDILMMQLVEDVSNLMLLDALTGQNDRFPGGNVHFAAVDGEREIVGERRGNPIYDMGDVRILALDNGAAMHSSYGTGIADLQGENVAGTRIERFEPETVERLHALGRRTIGHGCEQPAFEDEAAAAWTYFGLDADQGERAGVYLGRVLDYIDGLEGRYGDDIFIAPIPAIPDDAVAEP